MTQIILTGVAGFLFLVGFSFFLVWLDERSKKGTTKKLISRFQYFDTYYSELEKESEKNLEEKRKERMEILGYTNETTNKKSKNIDVERFSGDRVI